MSAAGRRQNSEVTVEETRPRWDGYEADSLGQNVSYGGIAGKAGLAQLLQRANATDGTKGIRLRHPIPDRMSHRGYGDSPKVCKHLHCPPQAGSDILAGDEQRLYG